MTHTFECPESSPEAFDEDVRGVDKQLERHRLGSLRGGVLEEKHETLRVLIVEDVPDDAELLRRELGRAGYTVSASRVDTEEDFLEALETVPDVILADFTLPQFNALRALRLLQERRLDVPFVVVTGTTGEESAVECIREGANDYLLKDRLARLGPAVARALAEQRLRNENRRVESELRRSEVWSRKLFEASLDAVIVSDRSGSIIDWNPRAEETFGWTRSEALGRQLVETIVPPSGREVSSERLESIIRRGDDDYVHERLESTALTRAGDVIPVELTISALCFGEDCVLGTFVRDLSEHKRAEEEHRRLEAQLLQAQRMEAVGLLASGVAHDFNNILTVIMGQSQILLGREHLDDDTRGRLEEIDGAGERAALLTSQLLAFGRRQVLQPAVVDLNAILDGMSSMLDRILREDIVIETHLAPELSRVRADRAQIEQVVVNLAVNARDAMPRGGRLTIRTSNVTFDESQARRREGLPPGSYVMLSVADLGEGMSQDVLTRIFDPFYTTKELGRGSGLGLSTVYGIVKQSHGYVYVSSELGNGSTFEVLLPSVTERCDRPPLKPPGPARGEGKVLLVENDPAVRRLSREVLELSGFVVLETSGGHEAMGRLEREEGRVDLVITDLVMPGMAGDELARLLSARYPTVKVLYASGHLERPISLTLEAGYRELLKKPFDSGELVRRVVELIDARSDCEVDKCSSWSGGDRA